jgi:hypothetical protein
MKTMSRMTLVCMSLIAFLALSGQAFSTTVAVGSCSTLINFATIQQAVNAVPPGSTIRICPGNYHEQVVISEKLTLEGVVYAGTDAVVILPPTSGAVANTSDLDDPSLPIAAQILVQNTDGPVLISNLTVDGTGNGITGCAPDLDGILFQNSSGTINHVAVRNQTLSAGLGGCQSGEGIYVQTGTGLASNVIIENNSVHNYNKNGITGNDAGTKLTVTGNYVQGSGVVASGGAAQNGIQLAFGATGKISSNTVTDNIYGDITLAASADILLFDTQENSAVTVSSNVLGSSQIPIGLFTDTAGVGDGIAVTGNKIFGTSSFDAIDVCTNKNTIKSNAIFNSAESGIHLDASCGNTGNDNVATSNTIVESSCAGVLSDLTTDGNTITPNTYETVPFTTATSTSKCTIPAGPMSARVTRNVSGRSTSKMKVQPAR